MYPGLITALHIKLFHPSRQQLQRLASRYFFCLNSVKVVDQVSNSCPICVSLTNLPNLVEKQSTSPSGSFASKFSADICKQHKQLIFICRENLSSFTISRIVPDETTDSIREAILATILEFIPESGAIVRLDPASAHKSLEAETDAAELESLESLKDDSILKRFGIKVELGRTHNPNKNPVAENAVKEFLKERLRLKPEGGPVSEVDRCVITRNMNSRIRNRGLAPKEILLRRDLASNEPKNIADDELCDAQTQNRLTDHPVNEKSKATYNKLPECPNVKIGDHVFIRNDLSKLRGREQYKVVELFEEKDTDWAVLQKSDSQLRSKRYNLKLTEVVPVPFGNDTVKDVPQIVFSQELDPIQGFPTKPSDDDIGEPIDELKRKKDARAKLIDEIQKEIDKERKRGRPSRKKYPETEKYFQSFSWKISHHLNKNQDQIFHRFNPLS